MLKLFDYFCALQIHYAHIDAIGLIFDPLFDHFESLFDQTFISFGDICCILSIFHKFRSIFKWIKLEKNAQKVQKVDLQYTKTVLFITLGFRNCIFLKKKCVKKSSKYVGYVTLAIFVSPIHLCHKKGDILP